MSKPSVLIIGAGLGGLALAQSLRKQHISFQIFERDASRKARAQGWAILLQWILPELLSSTLRDLPPLEECSVTHELGIPTEYAAFEGGKEVGRNYGLTSEGDTSCLRVNRARFRDWLSEHLDIQWNKRFSHYEEIEGGVKAYFEDGTTATGDMLVGADGIQSHVRGQLLKEHPPNLNTIPIGSAIGELTLTKEQYERQLAIAPSFYIVVEKDHRLFCGLTKVSDDQSTADYYWLFFWDDPAAVDPNFWTHKASQKEMLDFSLEKIRDMDPRISELPRLTKPEGIVVPPIRVRDWVPEELPTGRVTLLGDAAHPMTFFRGEGANNAMQDGLNLAKVINSAVALSEGLKAGEKVDVPKTLKKYNIELLERGRDAVLKSRAAATGEYKGIGPYQHK